MEELEESVVEWAQGKGIFENSSARSQMGKMIEEVNELDDEVFNKAYGADCLNEVRGELGDVLVTAIIQAHFHGLSLQSCLQQAHDKITKRTGKMVDGQFVKDSY